MGNWTTNAGTGTTLAISPGAAPKRTVPRYKLTVPLRLNVLRSGIPDNIAGRSLEIGEGGMGVVVASKLLLGETVRIEFLLPHMTAPVRATAVVRYQHERCFGLQFLRLPVDQQAIIRYWTRCEGEISLSTHDAQPQDEALAFVESATVPAELPDVALPEKSARRFRIRHVVLFAIPLVLVVALLAFWRWQQAWKELEAQLPQQTLVLTPQLKVPAEEMERRIIHRVTPEYPEPARSAGVQGTVILDVVVSADGMVTQVNLVSGSQVLSQAAIDAVRWWRYEPYFVNGQATTVETTVAVDFRLAP